MSELAEIIEEIKVLKPILKENLDQGDPRTLNGRRGRQARAFESMKELTEAYSIELRRNSIFILVAGEYREDFINTIVTNDKTPKARRFGSLVADPEEFYRDIVKEIHPSMYRSGTSNLFDIFQRVLENKMLALNVMSYPQPLYKGKYERAINNEADMLTWIKEIINDQVGSEMAVENAIRSITKEAIEKGHKEKITTVILNTPDETLTLDLVDSIRAQLTPYCYLVVAGKASTKFKITGAVLVPEVTLETTKQAMKAIKEMAMKV